MCGQVTSSALGLGAGGRSPGYLTRKSRSTRTKATTRVGQVRKPRAHLEQQLDSTVILIGVIGLPTLLACAIGYAMSRAIGAPVAQLRTNAELARNGNIELMEDVNTGSKEINEINEILKEFSTQRRKRPTATTASSSERSSNNSG